MPVSDETEQDDRGSVYVDSPGVVVYRSSGLGGCIKGLVAARKGLTPLPYSDDTLRRFADGHLHEASILREVEKQGWLISGQQKIIELPVMNGIVIRGHIDGIATDIAGTYVVDAKAVSKDSWTKFKESGIRAFPQYQWQLSTYMIALGLPGMLAFKNKDSGKVLVRTYAELPFSLLDIKRRIYAVEQGAKKPIGLTPCDNNTYSWTCVWKHYHDERTVNWNQVDQSANGIPDSVSNTLADLAAEYDIARANEKAEKSRKDALGQEIIELLRGMNLTAAETDYYTVKYGYWHKPSRLNEEAIAERLGVPDLDRFRIEGELGDKPTPTITRKKDKGN